MALLLGFSREWVLNYGIPRKQLPSGHLLVQSQQWKHQNDVFYSKFLCFFLQLNTFEPEQVNIEWEKA